MIDGLPPMPPQQHEMVMCSIGAGLAYGVPVNVMLAVAEQESGKPGQWVRNTNGTYDVGTMQFNTTYLRELQRYGITPQAVAQPGCYPYQLAAWRLRGHLKNDQGDIWTRAANYHSRTPQYNERRYGRSGSTPISPRTWWTANRLYPLPQTARATKMYHMEDIGLPYSNVLNRDNS
jgi:hypothetical protein